MLRTVANGSSSEQHSFSRNLADWVHPRSILMVVMAVVASMLVAGGHNVLLEQFIVSVFCCALSVAGVNVIVHALLIHDARNTEEVTTREKLNLTTLFLAGYVMVTASILGVSLRVNWTSGLVMGVSAVVYIITLVQSVRHGNTVYFVLHAILASAPVIFGWLAARGTWSLLTGIMAAFLIIWTLMFHMTSDLSEVNYRYSAGTLTPIYGPILSRKRIVWFSLLLVIVSLLPLPLNFFSPMYFMFALVFGAWMIQQSLRLYRLGTRMVARQLVEFSMLYLATLLFMMLFEAL